MCRPCNDWAAKFKGAKTDVLPHKIHDCIRLLDTGIRFANGPRDHEQQIRGKSLTALLDCTDSLGTVCLTNHAHNLDPICV